MKKRVNKILKNALRILNIRILNRALLGPHVVSIHVSSSCDDSCIFCLYHSPYSLKPPTFDPDVFMDVDQFQRLIIELEKSHVDMILLAGNGEPLEHPLIGEYLQFIDQRGIETVVRTNGIGLRRKIGNLTTLHHIRYCISLHAASPETWTSIHLGKSETDYWDIMDYMRGLPPETSRRFSLSNALCRLNYSEASEMVTLAHTLGVNGVDFQPVMYTGLEKMALDRIGIYGEERRVFRRKLLEAREVARKLNVRSNLDYVLLTLSGIGDPEDETLAKNTRALYQHIACYIGYWFSVIEPDGEVLPCCGCSESLGNIGTTSFEGIWTSNRYQEFRRKAKRQEFEDLHGCRCWDCVHYRINAKIHRALHPLYGFRRLMGSPLKRYYKV